MQDFEKTDVIAVKSQSERVSKSDLIKHLENRKNQQSIIVLKKDDLEIKSKSVTDNLIILELQNNFARLLNLSTVKEK